MSKPFTHRQQQFILGFIRTQSLHHAADFARIPPEYALTEALAFMADADVREAIRKGIAHQKPRVLPEQVMDKLWKIACADPRELVKTSRICCRHCWGQDHDYQRTRWEHKQHLKAGGEEEGGAGYDPRKAPNADCPECRGKGQIVTEVPPLEELSDSAVALCAGLTVLPNGLRVKTHNQLKALELIGKHLGMFGRRLQMTQDQHEDMRLSGELMLDGAQEYSKDMQRKGKDAPRNRPPKHDPANIPAQRAYLINAIQQNTGKPITPDQLADLDRQLGTEPQPAPEPDPQPLPAGFQPIDYREWYEQRQERDTSPLTRPLPYSHDPIHMNEEHSGTDPPH